MTFLPNFLSFSLLFIMFHHSSSLFTSSRDFSALSSFFIISHNFDFFDHVLSCSSFFIPVVCNYSSLSSSSFIIFLSQSWFFTISHHVSIICRSFIVFLHFSIISIIFTEFSFIFKIFRDFSSVLTVFASDSRSRMRRSLIPGPQRTKKSTKEKQKVAKHNSTQDFSTC